MNNWVLDLSESVFGATVFALFQLVVKMLSITIFKKKKELEDAVVYFCLN